MTYDQITDSELNRAVAKIMYPGDQVITPYRHRDDAEIFHNKNGLSTMADYCNSWSDAGPIIEDNKISLEFYDCGLSLAFSLNNMEYNQEDNNPLRAAMIVFLMMQENKDE